jgi:hypothetical protein
MKTAAQIVPRHPEHRQMLVKLASLLPTVLSFVGLEGVPLDFSLLKKGGIRYALLLGSTVQS